MAKLKAAPFNQRGTSEAQFAIVVIASSMGGIAALKCIVAELPPDFPLPILICQHLNRSGPSYLPAILAQRTSMRVVVSEAGVRPQAGTIYIAPPNRHLLVGPDRTLALSDEERVNWCRPAADVLFSSVSSSYGARSIGVVLTGYGQDGAFGARAITRRGGLVIAQDKVSAAVGDMPRNARDLGGADLVLPLEQIARALIILAGLTEESGNPCDGSRALSEAKTYCPVG